MLCNEPVPQVFELSNDVDRWRATYGRGEGDVGDIGGSDMSGGSGGVASISSSNKPPSWSS
jgi:hypothetical protein